MNKRRNITKRIVASLMCLAMVFCIMNTSVFTINVYAAENDGKLITEDVSDYVLQSGGMLDEDMNVMIDNPIMLFGLDFMSPDVQGAVAAIKEAISQVKDTCDISAYHISRSDMGALFATVLNTSPEFFYLQSRYSYYYRDTEISKLVLEYKYDRDTIASMRLEYESAVRKILSGVKEDWTDTEKALYVHDYIVDNCEYDLTYSNYDAYNVFVENVAVCHGYALAYKELMDRVGIPCQVVTSELVGHAWNILCINDEYYYVDTTWDDLLPDLTGKVQHTYFMKSYNYLSSQSHRKEGYGIDWVITENWYNEMAEDESYDDSFFNQVDAGLRYVDGYWYAKENDKINKYQYRNKVWEKLATIYEISDIWYTSDAHNSYWLGKYSSLSMYDGLLYLAGPDAIYIINPVEDVNRIKVRNLTEGEKRKGSIYGIYITTNGMLKMELRPSPNEDGEVVCINNFAVNYSCSIGKHKFLVESTTVVGAKLSDATCTEPAKYHKCCACGAISTSDNDVFEYGEPLGHSWGEYTYEEDADCLNDGHEKAACIRGCGTENRRVAEGTHWGHDFSKYISNGNGTHKVVCKDCNTVLEGHEKDACSGGTATGTAKAICSKCKAEYTEPASVVITIQPKDVTLEEGKTATLTVEATGEGLKYQWQCLVVGSKTWVNTTVSGNKTNTITMEAATKRNGVQYRCVVTDKNGKTTSTAATFTVTSANSSDVKITSNPQSVTETLGNTVTMSVAATGEGLKYQWQCLTVGSTNWVNTTVSGNTTNTITMEAATKRNGVQYRCVVTDKNGKTATSTAATFTVTSANSSDVKITSNPQSVTETLGNTVTMSVTATGEDLKYQWQCLLVGSTTWANTTVSGNTTNTITMEAIAKRDGVQYRCVVTDKNGKKATSTAATLTIGSVFEIVSQPSSVTTALGNTVTMKVQATGEGLKYQWQCLTVGSTNWVNTTVSGNTTNTITMEATTKRNGVQYRCVVTDKNGKKATSTAATLKVK